MKTRQQRMSLTSVRPKNRTIFLFVCLSLLMLSAAPVTAQTICTPQNPTTFNEPPPPTLPTAAGGTFCDPVFGTKIMRVTNETTAPGGAGTSYSYWPTFNQNNTKILVVNPLAPHQGDIYDFNPTTFTLGDRLPAMPYVPDVGQTTKLDDAVWSYTEPNKL
ncbi:MAG TPA: hypothetical protein VGB76_13075, partial [Pyrinomonadaceae bacterium]